MKEARVLVASLSIICMLLLGAFLWTSMRVRELDRENEQLLIQLARQENVLERCHELSDAVLIEMGIPLLHQEEEWPKEPEDY